VTAGRWRNPQPSYTLAGTDENGAAVEWAIETGSVSTLRLRGVDRDFIQVGDRVRLAGLASLRDRPEMFAQNMLLDDAAKAAGTIGNELLTGFGSRWERRFVRDDECQ